MFKVGERVIFSVDNARGIVLDIKNDQCQVIWEDYFVSWESIDRLKEDNGIPDIPHFLNERKLKD